MNTLKIMHTGDLHLGLEFKSTKFDSSFAKKRRLELWETFENIIDRCNENSIDILLIAGDLYEESYFTISDMKRLASGFNLLKKTEVVIVCGNHDPIKETSLYSIIDFPKNVNIIKEQIVTKIEFEKLNTVVWGLSFNKEEIQEELLKDIEIEDNSKINILLSHGDIFNKKSRYMPIDLKKINTLGFNYIALGHIHKHEFIDGKIAYSGSPEPLDSSETGQHGVIEGEINLEETNLSFVPISKREFIKCEINIDSEMSYYEIIDKIVSELNEEERFRNLFTFTLKGLIDKDISVESIVKKLKDKFLYINIIDETQVDLDIEKLYKDNKENIIGLFIKEMKRKNLNNKINKKALYIGLETLLCEQVRS